MTERALELLAIPPDQPSFVLDIGCGSGLSGEMLDDEAWCLSHGGLEMHYMRSECFLQKGQLLDAQKLEPIKDIPSRSFLSSETSYTSKEALTARVAKI